MYDLSTLEVIETISRWLKWEYFNWCYNGISPPLSPSTPNSHPGANASKTTPLAIIPDAQPSFKNHSLYFSPFFLSQMTPPDFLVARPFPTALFACRTSIYQSVASLIESDSPPTSFLPSPPRAIGFQGNPVTSSGMSYDVAGLSTSSRPEKLEGT